MNRCTGETAGIAWIPDGAFITGNVHIINIQQIQKKKKKKEIRKSTRKSISLPQSRRPLMKAIECLNESLGASEVDGTFPMPPTTVKWNIFASPNFRDFASKT